MPFEFDDTAPFLPDFEGVPDTSDPTPDFFTQTLPAAFRLENLVGSALTREYAQVHEQNAYGDVIGYARDEGFDPLTDEYLAGYEEHADRFARALTREQGEAIRANIDRERADRDTLAQAGVPGFVAALLAGILDPTVLIPVGGQVRRGASLLETTSRFSLAAGAGATLAEAGLHATQETRTLEESGVAIGGAVLLGGVLGGAAYPFLRTPAGRAAARQAEDDMVTPRAGEPDWADPVQALPAEDPQPAGTYARAAGEGGSVGAAARELPDIDEQAIAGVMARAVGESVRLQDPVLRSITSQSVVQRRMIEELADVPAGLVKNEARWQVRTLPDGREQRYLVFGRRSEQSVESAIRRRDALLGRAVSVKDDYYIRYLRGRDRRAGDILTAGVQALTRSLPAGRMTRPDFFAEVTRAMRRGDRHEIPEVQELAQVLRRDFFDPLKDEARDLGLFGYDLVPSDDPMAPPRLVAREPNVGETAESWIARVYNRERIAARRVEFTDIIHRHFIEERDAAEVRRNELSEEAEAIRRRVQSLRREARDALTAGNRAVKKAREDVQRADAAARAARARASEAGTQARQADRRVEATESKDFSPEDLAYYRGLQRDVIRGHGDDQPSSLSDFIRSIGGIREDLSRGELLAMDAASIRRRRRKDGTNHPVSTSRPNEVIDPEGRSPDEVAEAAAEAGYIGRRNEHGEIEYELNELWDALGEEFSGRRVYSEFDEAEVAYNESMAKLRDDMDEAGQSARDMDIYEFANFMSERKYVRFTSFKKGRYREALLRDEAAHRRLAAAEARLEDAEFDADDARVLARTIRENAPELTARANDLKAEAQFQQRALARARREDALNGIRADRTDDELLEDARRTVDHVLGGPAGRLSFDGPGARARGGIQRRDDAGALSGRFKARVLTIRDELIEDFLEDDLEHIMRVTQRSMVPDMEIIKRFGSLDMEVQLKQISEDYDRLIAAADGEANVRQLSKKKQNALADIEGVRDRLRGTYGLPADPDALGYRVGRFAVSLNYLRLMGGVTISSLSDLPRAVVTHGIRNAMGPAVRALTGDMRTWSSLMDELRDAGPGFEIVLNNRARAMADLMDDYGRGSRLERMVSAAQGHFGYASLIAPWNHLMKSISGFAVQNRILRSVEELRRGNISRKDATFLARIGIGEDDARAMAAAFRRHGETQNGQRLANSQAWEDGALRERWLNALRQEVDRLIVTPGMDKPLFASTGLGRVILQFRSYNFAATQRVLLGYLQGMEAGDAHAVMALTTQIGMGMMVAKLKAEQYGMSTDDWTAERWLVEGFDRSGVLGVLVDVNMMAEHASRGRVGLSALAGEGRLTRYRTRNAIGAYLGPSFGTAQDALSGLSALLSGEDMAASDVAALRRLLPFQNLFYIRGAFDAVEDAAADALGAEPNGE